MGSPPACRPEKRKLTAPLCLLSCLVLYCIFLYCTVLYCTVLCCTIQYNVIHRCALHCIAGCTVFYFTLAHVQYYQVLYCSLSYCTVLYSDVQKCTKAVLYSVPLYSTVPVLTYSAVH